MAAAYRCSVCGLESDNFPAAICTQCGENLLRPAVSRPLLWLVGLVQLSIVIGFMFVLHFRPVSLFFGLVSLLFAVLSFRARRSALQPLRRPASSQPMSVVLLSLTIAVLGLCFTACLIFGSVAFLNAHNAVARVEGQPYHASTFQVIRPYYQRSAGLHGPDISVYASGLVEGHKEWMDLVPYLKRAPSGQVELNDLVPPGTAIPVYLFPNLKGRSRIEVIDVLPPGEASRRTETWVLRRAPVALAVLGALILLLVRIRRSCLSPATQ